MTEQQDMRLVDSRMLPAAPHLTCTPRAPRPHTCPPHLQLAFLMAATSACEVHEAAAAPEAAQQPPAEGGGRPASSAALNLARSYLAQSRAAGAVLAAAQATEGQQAGADPKSDVFGALLVGVPARKPGILGRGCRSAFGGDVAQPSLLAAAASRCAAPGRNTASAPLACPQDFRLACLSQDTAAQLQALERCQALPAFGAEHFAMAAAVARGCASGGADAGTAGRTGSMEVCRAAEAARLQRLTQQAPMDYAAVAAVSIVSAPALCFATPAWQVKRL